MTRNFLLLLALACMAMTSCATHSESPAPDRADTTPVKADQCPPSMLTDPEPFPAKPKGASLIAPEPGTAAADASEAFLQWVQSVVGHAKKGDQRAVDAKAWCAGRQ